MQQQQRYEDDTWLKELDFWMHSVYTFTTAGLEENQDENTRGHRSPPIIIVGTHQNDLSASPRERGELVR